MNDLSSRFSGAPTYTIGAATGQVKEIFCPRPPASAPAALTHQVSAGDRLDLIAARYLGDPALFYRIVDANPSLRPEELLEVGRILVIPEVR
jgi:nucleoid-associated protein YgaU